jgi:hypothetical protein
LPTGSSAACVGPAIGRLIPEYLHSSPARRHNLPINKYDPWIEPLLEVSQALSNGLYVLNLDRLDSEEERAKDLQHNTDILHHD